MAVKSIVMVFTFAPAGGADLSRVRQCACVTEEHSLGHQVAIFPQHECTLFIWFRLIIYCSLFCFSTCRFVRKWAGNECSFVASVPQTGWTLMTDKWVEGCTRRRDSAGICQRSVGAHLFSVSLWEIVARACLCVVVCACS